MITNICWITYISFIILQSQFLGIEVQYMEKRDIHLCGSHSHTPFVIKSTKLSVLPIMFLYSLLLSHGQEFLHIPRSHWIILTFLPYQLTRHTV